MYSDPVAESLEQLESQEASEACLRSMRFLNRIQITLLNQAKVILQANIVPKQFKYVIL